MYHQTKLANAKQNMLKNQIREQFVLNEEILDLIAATPREFFVPKDYQALSFAEIQVPIGHSQVMMTPNEEAHMINGLQLSLMDSVLEIGTGTGYVTALLAKSCKHVESIDIFTDFTVSASEKINSLNIKNASLSTADGTKDYMIKPATYDVICNTASLSFVPKSYLEGLKNNGRLFVVIGVTPIMSAMLITRVNQNKWDQKILFLTELPEMIHAKKPEPFVF